MSSKRYPQEFRERAVRLLFENESQYPSRTAALKSIAEKTGVGWESLRVWVRQVERDNGQRPGLTTDERQRLNELEREVKELRRANEILKTASAFFARELDPATSEMISYIDKYKDKFGVEPICMALPIAPSTYYAAKKRPPSKRAIEDEYLKGHIHRVFCENFRVYGIRKNWKQLNREGIATGRDRVGRLMKDLGIQGTVRGKKHFTTYSDATQTRPADLVDRQFSAPAPNRLWVADLTYVRTWGGFVYACFIIDVFSRRIVGWQVSRSLRTDLAIDALEQAIWSRKEAGLGQLIHHSDRGSQFLSIRYTERIAEEGAVSSVGSRGDSYDNALAESVIGLYKTELITKDGPWRGIEDVEFATLRWVDWWNHRRLLEPIGMIPPAEFEDLYYSQMITDERTVESSK